MWLRRFRDRDTDCLRLGTAMLLPLVSELTSECLKTGGTPENSGLRAYQSCRSLTDHEVPGVGGFPRSGLSYVVFGLDVKHSIAGKLSIP